jgi:hypothetical protein
MVRKPRPDSQAIHSNVTSLCSPSRPRPSPSSSPSRPSPSHSFYSNLLTSPLPHLPLSRLLQEEAAEVPSGPQPPERSSLTVSPQLPYKLRVRPPSCDLSERPSSIRGGVLRFRWELRKSRRCRQRKDRLEEPELIPGSIHRICLQFANLLHALFVSLPCRFALSLPSCLQSLLFHKSSCLEHSP